jgi:ABC-type transport system substrate-binding protein
MSQKQRERVTLHDTLLQRSMARRSVLGGSIAAGLGIFGGAMLRGGALAGPAPLRGVANRAIQESVTPAEKQVLVVADDASLAKAIDLFVSVYERPVSAASDLFSEPLVRLNRDFDLLPASAESWEGSEDGVTWTFKIREGLMWSDGNPVTANDWVATFQHVANPETAWDFTWYFQGILKNWAEAIAGEVPVEEIGVRVGANDYELVFETTAPAPYLPAMLLYSNPLSAAALAEHGPLYNTDPATAVSAGPYILGEWLPDQQITYVRNEAYTGTLPGLVDEVRVKLTSPDNYFTMYQADEIDFMRNPAPAALTIMQSNEETAQEIYSGTGDFPTYYLFFDVTSEPWNDLKVRQAWSHAIDRDLLQQSILGPNGVPAYSFLAPGFPGNQTEAVKDIQAFDPELARSLLAEAGYPDGDGFPKQELLLRAPNPLEETVAQALAAMIKEHLNIDVEVVSMDAQGYMAALTAQPTQIPLGFIRYGMDFFDPASMLSVWLSGGRHSWSNEEYDNAVFTAAQFLGDPEERIRMFQDAERILVEDVPAVFVYHGTEVQFIKPWLAGEFIEPDKNGISALHFPVFTTMSTVPAELFIAEGGPER